MTDRVLVTDGEERAVLAVCRGLAAAGFSVTAAAPLAPAASNLSRSVERRVRTPDPRIDGAAFVDCVVAILEQSPHAFVIPGAEASLLRLSEQRERIEPLAPMGLPPHDVVLRALDRQEVMDAAGRAGLGAPETVECEDEPTALAAAERLGYPVVLKPRRSVIGTGEERLRQRPSRIVADEPELTSMLPLFGNPVSVQKHAPGHVVSLGGTAAGGAVLGLCAARYRRTWPPPGGSASFIETFTPDRSLVAALEQMLADLGWEGMFELETIAGSGGTHAAIDFNPRAYGSMTLAVAAGANLPALWANHVLGRQPASVRARPGHRYRWEEAELRNLLWLLRQGRARDAASILVPRRNTTHAFFRIGDPAPIAARPIALVTRPLRRRRARRAATSG